MSGNNLKNLIAFSYVTILTIGACWFVWDRFYVDLTQEPERPPFEYIHFVYNVGALFLDVQLDDSCKNSFIDKNKIEKLALYATVKTVPDDFKEYIHLVSSPLYEKTDINSMRIRLNIKCHPRPKGYSNSGENGASINISFIKDADGGHEYEQSYFFINSTLGMSTPRKYWYPKDSFYKDAMQEYYKTISRTLPWLQRTFVTNSPHYLDKYRNTNTVIRGE